MRWLLLALLVACDEAPVCGVPGSPCCLSGCGSDAAVCLPKRTCEAPYQCRLETTGAEQPEWLCFDPANK